MEIDNFVHRHNLHTVWKYTQWNSKLTDSEKNKNKAYFDIFKGVHLSFVRKLVKTFKTISAFGSGKVFQITKLMQFSD